MPTAVTAREAARDNLSVPRSKQAADVVAQKILSLCKQRGLSRNELAVRAGMSKSSVNQSLRRGSSFRADHLMAMAEVLDVPVQELAGGSALMAEVKFADFIKWTRDNKGIERALAHYPKITIGDLLRYQAEPSSQGEDPDAVWAQMQALRRGLDLKEGTDVSVEEEAEVIAKPGRKPKSR